MLILQQCCENKIMCIKSLSPQNECKEVHVASPFDVINSKPANDSMQTPHPPNRPYQAIVFSRYCEFAYVLRLLSNTTRLWFTVSKTKTDNHTRSHKHRDVVLCTGN